jgi:DNA-binding transcriptional ArsR family regulator
MDDGTDAVWRALANPHRRRICDLLRDGPKTTGHLDVEMDNLSRYAVMQHLGVLEEAGLIVARRQGRQRFNHLNAVPLREAYERWVSSFADRAAAGSVALKRLIEGEERMSDIPARAVQIVNEIRIKASPETIWDAMTTEQREWYPHNYGQDRLKEIVFERRVGGRVYEDWGDGAGTLYSTVNYYDPCRAYCTRGHLKGGITLEQWATLTPDGDETVLSYEMTAFGPITDEMAEGIRFHGDLSRYEDALRDYCEAQT